VAIGYNTAMKPTVYVETSVIGAMVDRRDDPITQAQRTFTLDWWENRRDNFALFISDAVIVELNRSAFPHQDEALALVGEMTMFAVTPEIIRVVHEYQAHLVMPQGSMGDATHLAVASVNKMDYLLTWNCRHLANPNKVRHIETINKQLGLHTPVLLTPEMLWGNEV